MRTSVSCLLLFFVFLCVFGQDREEFHNVIHLRNIDGLSDNAVMSIKKDHKGYIWIGTKNGLNRFDGERFKIFKNIKNDTTTLNHDYILSLENDSAEYLWIGSKKGINRYDHATRKIQRIYPLPGSNDQAKPIHTICRMQDGNVWFGTNNVMLIYKKVSNQLVVVNDVKNSSDFFDDKVVLKIFQDATSRIWIGTNKGIFGVSHDNHTNFEFHRLKSLENDPNDIFVRDIAEDSVGNLWIGTENKGLWIYDIKSDQLRRSENRQLADLDIRELQLDAENNLWIGSFEGILVRKGDGGIMDLEYLGDKEGPFNDGFKSVLLEKNGTVWAGGYKGGLKIWNKVFNSFDYKSKLQSGTDTDLGLVNTMAEDVYGNVYFGTKKSGISVLQRNGTIHEGLTKILTKEFANTTVKSFITEDSFLWIATIEKGVLVFDIDKQKFMQHILSSALKEFLHDKKVYSISKFNNICAIGTLDNGLIIYDLGSKKIDHYPIRSKIGDGILKGIRVVHFDTRGNLWIGTLSGLKRIVFNPLHKNKRIENFELPKDSPVTDNEIMAITEDHTGQILIGTSKQGLFIISDDVAKRVVLTKVSENASAIMGIVEDKDHNWWLFTSQGVIKYDPNAKKGYLFDQNYGVINTDFRNQSGLCTAKGNIFFGTSRGVIHFTPDELRYIEHAFNVVLTDFRIRGDSADYKYTSLMEDINDTEVMGLELPYDKNSFTIHFSSLEFRRILDNSYEYRLLGLHDDWKTSRDAKVNYVLQKPGDYTFEVRVKRFFGMTENQITTLPIHLKVAPWRSGYAVLFYCLFLGLCVLGVFKIIKSKDDLKHQLELENLEKIKEKEKHELQLDFFTNLSHDFRTPLTLIIAPLQQLIEGYKGKNVMYNKLVKVKRNADQLLNLVNQLLDFRKIESENYDVKIERGNIVDFIQKIYESFEEYAKLGNYQYNFETSSEEIILYYDSLLLKRVFYNLISNAFKNTQKAGMISVLITEKDDHVLLEVKDSGKGIDEEVIKHVFDRFFTVSDHLRYTDFFTSGMGIGLHIVKKIVEQHKGEIEVASAKEVGSVFRICLKKGDLHYGDYKIYNRQSIAPEPILNVPSFEIATTQPLDLQEFDIEKNLSQHCVLVIEDNHQMRKFITDLLKKDFNIEQAQDSASGYAKLLQKKIDLVICDVAMPGTSGTELCKRVKNDVRIGYIPFILLTSRYSESQKIEGLKSGADAYLTKPFSIQELLFTVRNLLKTNKQAIEKYNKDGETPIKNQTVDLEDEKLYKKALKIIHNNLNNSSFEMDSFSLELGISRRQLYRKIKQWTNQTPNEFLQTIRLQKASELLEIGGLTIAEVSYEVGFGNPQYFAKCFKKQFQKTPSEYANQFYRD